MPTISVIVPVYKVEPFLHRCVDSILGQSYEDLELILVDDGSPDRCGAICEEYAQKDPRVVVIHQENGGLSAARNAGIDWAFAHSDSQWLFFVDSDDFIHSESLQRLLEAATGFGTDISIGGYAETSGELPSIKNEYFIPELWKTRDFFIQKNINAIVAWGKLYRKDLFQQIRYPAGKIHEDEYTTYKILFAREQAAVIGAPLYGYYVNYEGITKRSWTPKRLDVLGAFTERIDFFKKRNDKEMKNISIRTYADVIAHQFELAKDYPGHRKKLRRLLARLILRHPRLFSVKDHYWQCCIAFPHTVPRLWEQ